jgi:hypothetical protein
VENVVGVMFEIVQSIKDSKSWADVKILMEMHRPMLVLFDRQWADDK